MESLAQKKARANFKKAIAYRKKTGCSLKEAFAHVSGKKTVVKKTVVKKRSSSPLKKKKIAGYVKTVRKAGLTDVIYTKAIKSKKSAKTIQKTLFGVKKKAAKKPSEKTILNKIHLVKKDVDKLDEAQHKHMMAGITGSNKQALKDYEQIIKKINLREFLVKKNIDYRNALIKLYGLKSYNANMKISKLYLKELKTHAKELKKYI